MARGCEHMQGPWLCWRRSATASQLPAQEARPDSPVRHRAGGTGCQAHSFRGGSLNCVQFPLRNMGAAMRVMVGGGAVRPHACQAQGLDARLPRKHLG